MKPRLKPTDRRARHPGVDAYLARLNPPQRRLAFLVRALVHEEAPGATEAISWGVPFFFLEDGICYVSAARTHVTLGFPNGIRVKDASGLLVGTGRSPIRKATLPLDAEPPVEVLRDWVRQAVALAA